MSEPRTDVWLRCKVVADEGIVIWTEDGWKRIFDCYGTQLRMEDFHWGAYETKAHFLCNEMPLEQLYVKTDSMMYPYIYADDAEKWSELFKEEE